MHLKKILILFIPLYLFVSAGICYGDEKAILAVVDFVGKNVSAAEASIFSDILRDCFVGTEKYYIVEKSNMERELSAVAFEQTEGVTSDFAVQVGKVLNV